VNLYVQNSLPHRPDDYIGFTSSSPPTFYNQIAPISTAKTSDLFRSGQYYCVSSLRNGGPDFQVADWTKTSGETPLDTKSAGFCFVGTCLQLLVEVHFWIKAKRRETNAGNRLRSLRMLWRTTAESVPNILGRRSRFNSLFTWPSSCTAITAAINSKRGMDVSPLGTSRAFDIAKVQVTLPFRSTARRDQPVV